jgi:hypothetical protein
MLRRPARRGPAIVATLVVGAVALGAAPAAATSTPSQIATSTSQGAA